MNRWAWMRGCWAVARLCAGLCLLGSAAGAQAEDYDITPVPAWVRTLDWRLPDSRLATGIDGGEQYLLVDSQLDLSRSPRAYFMRIVSMPINAAGVSSASSISIDYDPSYEQVHLHTLAVTREGHTLDRLGSAHIQVLQREQQLEAQLVDGRKTVSIVLDDVRVGDVIDYAYSLDGENPVFGGKISNTAQLQYGTPVARLHRSLRVPRTLDLRLRAVNTEVEPRVRDFGAIREYDWDIADVSALDGESGTPGWYSPTAKVQWSEFRSWHEVVEWARPLYAVRTAGPGVRREIERIAKAHSSPEQRLRAVLDFVQREVRYFGIESGPASHAPTPPELVLERRFGDCKDKTMLAVTMLDGLGIEAQPAFVNTSRNRGVRDLLPTPKAFDHALIHARVGERTYWLDPTLSPQAGDLDHVVQADYGLALIIDAGQSELRPMQGATRSQSRRRTHLTFDLRAGRDKPVSLSVTTTLDGDEADELRGSLATTSSDELTRHYLNFYAQTYPGIATEAPVEVEDDVENNRLITRERYRIDGIARRDESKRRDTVDVSAADINSWLKVPGTIVRHSPLAVAHPKDVEVTTDVLLDEGWDLKPSVKRVLDPAFEFERSIDFAESRLRIVDRFRSLADSVPAERVREYAEHMNQAQDSTGYQLYWTDAAADAGATVASDSWEIPALNGWLLAFALLAAVSSALLVWWMFRYDPPAAKLYLNTPPAPVGIGGWLILAAIAVLVRPLVYMASLGNLAHLLPANVWGALTVPGGDYHHWLWAPYAYVMTALVLWLLAASVALAVLFFQQRSSVPRLWVGMLAATLLVAVLDWAASAYLPGIDAATLRQDKGSATGAFFGLVLWASYFANSRRVRATFIVRRGARKARAAAEPPPIPAHLLPASAVEGGDPPRAG